MRFSPAGCNFSVSVPYPMASPVAIPQGLDWLGGKKQEGAVGVAAINATTTDRDRSRVVEEHPEKSRRPLQRNGLRGLEVQG